MRDPLAPLAKIVPWEAFRPRLEKHWPKPGQPPSRKRWDAVFMFKILVFATLHDLSNEDVAHMATDSVSLMRFLGLRLGDPTPDADTIRLCRKCLTKAGVMSQMLGEVERHLQEHQYQVDKEMYRPSLSHVRIAIQQG